MKKQVFLCVAALILIITGCGTQEVKKDEAVINQPEVIETTETTQKEITQEINEVEEIPSEDTITEDISEESPEETLEESLEEESPEEPSEEEIEFSHADEYWNLNYFNLYGFLYDNGAESITEETDNLGPETSYIEAKFGEWYVDIYTENYQQYANLVVRSVDPNVHGFFKSFDYEDSKTKIIISVDDKGTMVHQVTIDSLEELIVAIKNGSQLQLEGYVYP